MQKEDVLDDAVLFNDDLQTKLTRSAENLTLATHDITNRTSRNVLSDTH